MNLSVIILTYNEELHIERCIRSLKNLDANIYLIDSYSTDKTIDIAKSMGVKIYQNPFVNQAVQFQWAIDNCDIKSEWVLRMDADETIDSKLSNNINEFLQENDKKYNGAIFYRKHIFLGKWVKNGGRYPLAMLRLFRRGTAHIEQKWMDEHIVLDCGEAKYLEGGFEDDNLNSVTWFIDKHNKYATREVVDIILKKLNPENNLEISKSTGLKIRLKRFCKNQIYLKLPYFVRPTLYFLYRYFIQLGFLDGKEGFAYHFMQGFWYRCLVDLKCLEFEKELNKIESISMKISKLEELSGYKLS